MSIIETTFEPIQKEKKQSSGGCGCSTGGCASGGCNKLNSFDWLADLPLESGTTTSYIEVSFNKGSRKEFFISNGLFWKQNDYVVVETTLGYDIGLVALTGNTTLLQIKKKQIKLSDITKKTLRKPNESDWKKYQEVKLKEKESLVKARKIMYDLKLEMKIIETEIQGDGKKITFYYTADDRIDFRELIKRYASEFKMKIEMKQIGMRQEAAKVGGIGSCGRELCCSSWMTEFKPVNTQVARYQNINVNSIKLNGQCGRLKCCLNYELDWYVEVLETFPKHADFIHTQQGQGKLFKKDFFKKTISYYFEETKQTETFSINDIKYILDNNKKNIKPDISKMINSSVASKSANNNADNASSFNNVESITLKNKKRQKR